MQQNNYLLSEYNKIKQDLFDKYYNFLNDKQKEALYTINDPLLILAGAGSGKTTVLVNRLAYIIRYGNAYYSEYPNEIITENTINELKKAFELSHDDLGEFLTRFAFENPKPYSVLAITFTNKAADEIKNRIKTIFGDDSSEANDIWAGTFHSICMRILRYYGSKLGYNKTVGICDADDSKKLITSIMKRLEIDEKFLSSKDVQNTISRAKDRLETPEIFNDKVNGDAKLKQISKIYFAYQDSLKSSNLLDFDDIIMQTVFLLRDNPDVLDALSKKFKYVSVDEYQDTNHAQFVLSKYLSSYHNNIMVVGDEDQSIYKFRGATIENILSFQKQFKNAKIVKLEQNYRSTKTILDAANTVISQNKTRIGKTLWTDNNNGDLIQYYHLEDQLTEARKIADIISDYHDNGGKYSDFAILYRMNAQSRSFENTFANAGIPYRILCGLSFYERAEIKDLIAYLFVINNPKDSIHLKRIINTPRRGIGDHSINIAETISISEGCPLLDVLSSATSYNAIPTSTSKAMIKFANLMNEFIELKDKISISELLKMILDKAEYMKMLESLGENEVDRIDNVQEFVSSAKQYESTAPNPSLNEFLEEISLVADVDNYDENADTVTLMTIHSAKGLEFNNVIIPGMEESIFPSARSMYVESDIEEERRLAYVAYTRAKKVLYITTVSSRFLNGSPQRNPVSRFFNAIPNELISSHILGGNSFFSNTTFNDSPFFKTARTSPIQSIKKESIYKDSPFSSTTTSFTPPKPTSFENYEVGDVVKHSTFGIGTITDVKEMGSDLLYTIDFEVVGQRRLMASYARLTKISS